MIAALTLRGLASCEELLAHSFRQLSGDSAEMQGACQVHQIC